MTNLDRWLELPGRREVVITQGADPGVIVELLEWSHVEYVWQRVGYGAGRTISRAVYRALKEAEQND